MKTQLLILTFLLSFLSCKESLEPVQPLKETGAKARTADDLLDSAVMGTWQLSSVHNGDWESHSPDNDPCYQNVVWKLNSDHTWQVLNYSGGSCGTIASGDYKFSSWMQQSGYSGSKTWTTYRRNNKAYIQFSQGNGRYFNGAFEFVDNKYFVIPNESDGGNVILFRDPIVPY